MDDQLRFRALYYPYSRCLYETDLKRAVLVFDEILFVDPLSKDLSKDPGQYPMYNPHIMTRGHIEHERSERRVGRRPCSSRRTGFDLPKWYRVSAVYKVLCREGIARLVDPKSHIEQHAEMITYAVLNDLVDGVGGQIGAHSDWLSPWLREDGFGWKLHSVRVPQLLRDLLSDNRTIKKCLSLMKLDKSEKKYLKERIEGADDALLTVQVVDDKTLILPFDVAYSLVLNQALVLCEEEQAFPVTDDRMAHAGLLAKASSLYTQLPDFARPLLPKRRPADLYRIQSFTLAVVSRLVPDVAFESLDIEAVIEFRQVNRERLLSFQHNMVELSASITANEWDSSFQEQVLRVIDTKILPEVRDLDRQLRDSYRKLFGNSMSKLVAATAKIAAPALPTLTLASFFGLSLGQMALLGAAAAMSGLGMTVPDLVAYWRERGSINRNGLSYLMNFKNRALSRAHGEL